VQKVLAQGITKTSVLTTDGLQVDLRIVPAENLGAALLYFTGSKEHNVRLRSRAIDQGMTLSEWGIYRTADYDKSAKKPGEAPPVKAVASRTEADVYKVLGLPYIEPELREDRGEIDAAAAGKLPDLIELKNIRGDLHCHTTASDGADSILAMAEAAIERGYQFLAITDHSKSSAIANGLSVERLLAHIKAIHKVREQVKGLTLLAGSEVDILADGHLDYEPEVLAELDFVVASPHVALRQEREKATDRLVRAIESRYVNVIGHPTGRLIDMREGLPVDFARIFRAAAATGTALEINGAFPRFDLNDAAARSAAEAGAMIAVDTDAHGTGGLANMMFGVEVARRAWLCSRQVINCLTPAKLREFISRKR
jgi:DNA polymerase (family 10)